MKEKIFYEMINLVKIFSFLILVSSIVVITIRVCETTKRDFKLKNIFRFIDEKKVNKKSKKEIKNVKDLKVHYIDGNNPRNLIQPPLMHTLIPLHLPVHLPLPSHSDKHLLENHVHPQDQPYHDHPHLDHLHPEHPHHVNSYLDHLGPEHPHHNHPDHDHIHSHAPIHPSHGFPMIHQEHLPHFHPNLGPDQLHPPNFDIHSHQMSEQSNPLVSEASMIRPVPQPIIIHQQFNPIPIGVSEHISERISYPVFELIDNHPKEPFRKMRVRSKSESYGRTKDSFETDWDNESDYDMNNKKKRISKENKRSQTTVKLVNKKKFNTINNFNTKFDELFDENIELKKTVESDKYLAEKQSRNQKINEKEKDLNSLDNRIDEKRISSEVPVVPEEQIVNVVEDEWTFKDLDLWIIR